MHTENNELVEYAFAGMNQRLFVSKYQLALPTKKDMEDVTVQNTALSGLALRTSPLAGFVRQSVEGR